MKRINKIGRLRVAIIFAIAVGLVTQLTINVYRAAQPDMARAAAITYRTSPYWGPDFWKEQAAVNAVLTFDDKPCRWRGDYHGQYVNVVDGWRQVTDTPAHYDHTLWLFGSSTIRDSQVPDWYTKASYLQRLMPSYRVLNRSDDGIVMQCEVELLKASDVRRGDLVVFYGGGHNPDDYTPLTLQARQVAQSSGATFYAFLESQIWSAPLSVDEQIIMANIPYIKADDKADIIHRWTQLEPASAALARMGVAAYDLTHALDAARAGGVIVNYDHIHTNEYGNAIIARAIFDWITVL